MKKVMFFGLMLVISLWTNAIYANSINLGYHKFSPYEFKLNEKPAGIMVDIVQAIFNKLEVPLKLQFLPFKRALEYTKKGRNDGLFILYKTPERMKYFDYTEPLVNSPLLFFVRKDSNIKFEKLPDLKGLKIGVMHGYTYGAEFDNAPYYKLDPGNSHETNFKKLISGRVDAYICDKWVGISTARKINAMSDLKTLPVPLKVMSLYMVFTKGKHQALIDKINPIIKSMTASGEIDNLINQFLNEQK